MMDKDTESLYCLISELKQFVQIGLERTVHKIQFYVFLVDWKEIPSWGEADSHGGVYYYRYLSITAPFSAKIH